ncbi:MAG TPA: hypothetical protein VOB72_09070 [Candidatus Dormibacteraeota bacterium]|nr:hypothetical protein [Candidatus Dormibacteraeota bacterium]
MARSIGDVDSGSMAERPLLFREPLSVLDPANALGYAACQAAHRLAGGRPHLVQGRAQEACPRRDAPQGAIGGTLCGLLDNVGAVLRHRRPAGRQESLLHSRVAQLPCDDLAAKHGATECSPRALWSAVNRIHQRGTEETSPPQGGTRSTIA